MGREISAPVQELEKDLGVAINVTHKPGGGGAVAWSEFQRTAKPTGYDIIGCNIPHIIGQPMIRKDAGYKTDGFKVIMWFHFTPNVLVVSKDSEFKTLDDFIAFAKKRPFVATVGGSGTYSANHLETLRLMKAAGVDLTYVPYTGTGPVIPAVMGGHIKAAMSYSMVGVQYKAKFRTLARRNGYPAVLAESMVTESMVVYRIVLDDREVFMDGQEYQDLTQDQRDRITLKQTIVAEGELLTMDDSEARELGFSTMTVASLDDLLARAAGGVLDGEGPVEAGAVAVGRMLLVAEVVGHFALESALDEALLELLEGARIAEDLLGGLVFQ